ncbi:hypothetical protein Cni_G24383 [Canna indica]|uniref:Uncharacterized protein n=1 Tax=Canna indica TaxID=4628 RepID=A0AAQ3L2B2_9LILI|nr:hypothetical protein Cni_G24383 [Canna indica]
MPFFSSLVIEAHNISRDSSIPHHILDLPGFSPSAGITSAGFSEGATRCIYHKGLLDAMVELVLVEGTSLIGF